MMKFKSCGLIALFFTFLFNISTVSAVDYYVNASTGSNSNSGALGFPVKTIQYAMTLGLLANDKIFIESGDYSADSIAIDKSLTFELNGIVKLGILKMRQISILLTLDGNTSGQLDISKTLYLDSGNILANNTTAKLRLLDGAKQVNGSTKSFISGGYAFQYVSNTFTNFTWHLGNAKDYRPVYLAAMNRSGIGAEDYYAQFNPTSGLGVNSTLDVKTRNISTLNHWFLSKTSASVTTTNIQLRFYFNKTQNDDQVYDAPSLQILRSISSAAWVVINKGGSSNNVGSISTGVMISGDLGHFVLGNEKGGSNYQGGINTLGNTTDPFIKIERLEGKKCEEDTLKFRALVKNVNVSTDPFTWNFGDAAAYTTAGYLSYNKTTVPANPDTLAFHVFRVAGSYLVSVEVENAIGGKKRQNQFSSNHTYQSGNQYRRG